MRLTRRGFLGVLATGAVGACVTWKIPTRYLPAAVKRLAACEFMRTHVDAWGADHAAPPEALYLGGYLYQAYESEVHANSVYAWEQQFHGDSGRDGVVALWFRDVPVYQADPWNWTMKLVGRPWPKRGADDDIDWDADIELVDAERVVTFGTRKAA